MWFGLLLVAGIWAGVGRLVQLWPEMLAGYNTMSPERKRWVDIRAMGRFCARLMYVCSGIMLAGLPLLLFFDGETVAGSCLALSVAMLLVGAVRGSWKYDRKFLAGLKKRLGRGCRQQ